MKVKLTETQKELEEDNKELGLMEDSAPRENVYCLELPIAICSPFNADFDGKKIAVYNSNIINYQWAKTVKAERC